MRNRFFLFFIFLLFPKIVSAQSAPMMPHFPGMETGTIEGKIFQLDSRGKKTPLPQQTLAIMVFKDGQRILMLDKEADTKGNFTVGNVFKDLSFVYALGTLYEDRLYVIPNIQLSAKEDKKVLDFPVGAGSPYWVQNTDPPSLSKQTNSPLDLGMPSQASSQKTEFSVASAFAHSHQKLALVLSGAVLLFAFYFALKKDTLP